MQTINAVREKRATKFDEMQAIIRTADLEGRSKTDDENARFWEIDAELKALDDDIKQREVLAQREIRSVIPLTDTHRNLERRVSALNVIRAQTNGTQLDGAELEFTQEAERRTGRKAQGAFIPFSMFERRDNTTTTAAGLVPVDHRADQYIDALRENLMARRLGVRVLSGLSGNVDVPKYGTGLETGWVAEGGAVPESDMTFESVTLTPKHVGGKTEMSRQLIMQSSPDIEQLVRDDLAYMIAKQLDYAIVAGSGTNNEPQGILNNPDIQTYDLGVPPNITQVMRMIQRLEDKELFNGQWLTDGSGKTLFSTTLVSPTSFGSEFMLQNGVMGGRPLNVSRRLVNQVLFGDFSQVMLGIWSEIDILVNPYAEPAYTRGGVQVRAMATCDVALRYPEAFVLSPFDTTGAFDDEPGS